MLLRGRVDFIHRTWPLRIVVTVACLVRVHRAPPADTPGQVRHPPVVPGDGLEPPDGLVLQGQLPEDLFAGVRLRH